MPDDDLFTRSEVLTGLPTGRANTLLFLIESRTARLSALSRRAMERFLTEETARERDLAFIDAFAEGKSPPVKPTIQDIEWFAAEWASLVPDNPRIRAATAYLLAKKYIFSFESIPGIRASLGLDTRAVAQSFQSLYNQPIEIIFTRKPGVISRIHWTWKAIAHWLESLDPFWTAFALTLTETVGAGILALPIAVAGIGPIPGVILLVVLGLINIFTVAAMAEAVARNGNIRFRNAYFGRMIADYLGNGGSVIISISLVFLQVLTLLAYEIGFSLTLGKISPIPAPVWAFVLFLIILYFIRRESLNATVASALVVGAVNISLILILSVIALTHATTTNLSYMNVPFINGSAFDPSILGLIFGVILTAYFGHTSVGNCANVVLRRDPSGRSLLWGCIAGQFSAILLYSIWVLAVNGSVPSQEMVNQFGTALIPLAEMVGPLAKIIGSFYVVLAIGMGSINFALGLSNMIRERLPQPGPHHIVLYRRRGKLIFESDRKQSSQMMLALVYLGIHSGEPHLRIDVQYLGKIQRFEIGISKQWNVDTLLDQLPRTVLQNLRLVIQVQEAHPDEAIIQVSTSMKMRFEDAPDTSGFSMADLFTLPEAEKKILRWMLGREKTSLAEIKEQADLNADLVDATIKTLIERSYIQVIQSLDESGNDISFSTNLSFKIGRKLPKGIEEKLYEQSTDRNDRSAPGIKPNPVWENLLQKNGRFWISNIPLVLVLLLTEWLLFSGNGSFTQPLSFLGVIIVSLLGGIFPILLLAASRQKGDISPDYTLHIPYLSLFSTIIYLLFLASIFIHGLFIWGKSIQGAVACIVGFSIVGLTIFLKTHGAFSPRLLLVLRRERGDRDKIHFSISIAGKPMRSSIQLRYQGFDQSMESSAGEISDISGLQSVIFQIPNNPAWDLKVWAYQVGNEGHVDSLSAGIELQIDERKEQYDLSLSAGQALATLRGNMSSIALILNQTQGIDEYAEP
jgi:amino acid permease